MLPPERRLPAVRDLVDQAAYCVVHAPRQSGKTTALLALAGALRREGRYAALLASCETGQAASSDLEEGISLVGESLRQDASVHLPQELRPPAISPSVPAGARLRDLLLRWSQQCPLPVVLFLDEIDALRDETLLSVLRQVQSGYPGRPRSFPQSVALIGLRDVRDYRTHVRPETETLGTSSPFNIKIESLTLRNFTADEVAELYSQHTAETGQTFTAGALALAHELTRGQPWLVNALARQVVEQGVTDRGEPVEAGDVERAKEALIERRDAHLDSLVDRLREPRVRRVLEPILAGELLSPDVLDSEAAPQLISMAFLQRVVNGGGWIDREYGVGRGRIDLFVRWTWPGGVQRWAIELKVRRDGRPDPLTEGAEQLSAYLDRLGLDSGTLILFDARSDAPPVPQRCSTQELQHGDRTITVLRL